MQDYSWWYYLLRTWRTIEYLYQSLNKFIDIITEKQSKNWQGNLTEDFANMNQKSSLPLRGWSCCLLHVWWEWIDMGFPISKTLDFKITWFFPCVHDRSHSCRLFGHRCLQCLLVTQYCSWWYSWINISLLPSPYLFEMGLRSWYGFNNIQDIIILLNNLIFDCAQRVKIQIILKSNILDVGYQ